jgi:hypothetical protein
MDLTALETLSHHVESHSTEQAALRNREAEHFYVLGYTCLRLARKVDYNNRVLLRKSLEFLVQSIMRNRRDPQVLTCLAFLLLVCDATSRALPFLQEALALAPHHAEAQLLLTWAQGQTSALPELPVGLTPIRRLQEPLPTNDLLPMRTPVPLDQQAQALGLQLQTQIKKAFDATKRAKQSLDAVAQADLLTCCHELTTEYQAIATALEALEAQERQTLQRQLLLLDKLLRQLPGTEHV